MPRPRKAELEGKEVKKRSRNGCWPCKSRKVKCGEEKPACLNCTRQGEMPAVAVPSLASTVDMPAINTANTANTATSADGAPATGAMANLQPQPQHYHHQPEPALPPMSNFPGTFALAAADVNPAAMLSSSGFRTPSWNEPSSTQRRDSVAGPMIGPRGSISMPAYPSPSDSIFGGAAATFHNGMHDLSAMPPPLPTSGSVHFHDSVPSPYNSAKRRRLSPQYMDSTVTNPSLFHRFMPGINVGDNANGIADGARVHFPPTTPTSYPVYAPNPLTPAASIQTDDDRRISVSSLLSEEPDVISKRSSRSDGGPTSHPATHDGPSRRGSLHQRMISYSETELYGHDRGAQDLDIPHNNDANAISEQTPSDQADFSSWLEAKFDDPSFGFGTVSRQQVFAAGGYYASPVPIKIPRKLEPLPVTLTENPMNLLYFHHFLNHTAKILVPHDCPENPFKTILPKMAVENANLLNLMLAYSASHRARLLSQPEPANRIAVWVHNVFPSLRRTLDNVSNANVSNANLATAIMLASLEIISPSSFGVSIPWQNHLSVARSIIRSRGGPNSVSRQDPVMFFLTRWMAYLDVMGSLSGNRSDEPLFTGNYWSSSTDLSSPTTAKELSLDDESLEDEDDYTIDCLLGFTTKCVSILAQVALLARECEPHRIDPVTSKIRLDWRPGPDIEARADKLKRDLEHAMNHEQKNYAHESLSTNSAFHYAGLVHLLRRVHNLPRSDPAIQSAVHSIITVLSSVRVGGSAEACCLFPTITAGLEAEGEVDRMEVIRRLKKAEQLGMCQVGRARRLMEESWRRGESWEEMRGVEGAFFG
ncbi:hypothetical protein DV736_g127, partial [Chaetothyriales sp. CBS 134916]